MRPATAAVLLVVLLGAGLAYRTVPETEAGDRTGAITRFREGGADLVTFASSSAVENFFALDLPLPKDLKIASLGPITTATLKAHGRKVDVEAAGANLDALAAAIVKFYR